MRAAKNVIPDVRFTADHAAVLMRRGLKPFVAAASLAPPSLALAGGLGLDDDENFAPPLSPPRRSHGGSRAAPPSVSPSVSPSISPPLSQPLSPPRISRPHGPQEGSALPVSSSAPISSRVTWSSDPWLLSPTRSYLPEQAVQAFALQVTAKFST